MDNKYEENLEKADLEQELRRLFELFGITDFPDESFNAIPATPNLETENLANHLKNLNDMLYTLNELGLFLLKGMKREDLREKYLPQFAEQIIELIKQPTSKEFIIDKFIKLDEIFTRFSSSEYFLKLLSLSFDDSLIDETKKRFLDEFNRAREVNLDKTKRLFQDVLKFMEESLKPDELFNFSQYERLNLSKFELEKISFLDLITQIIMKESTLIKLDRKEVKDIIGDLLRRLRESIETYLKLILALTLNFSLISEGRNVISFYKNFKYYERALDLKGRYKGDYIEIRHAIAHNSYRIYIDNQITIRMIFPRKRENYSLQDLRKKFKKFNSIVFLFTEFIKLIIREL